MFASALRSICKIPLRCLTRLYNRKGFMYDIILRTMIFTVLNVTCICPLTLCIDCCSKLCRALALVDFSELSTLSRVATIAGRLFQNVLLLDIGDRILETLCANSWLCSSSSSRPAIVLLLQLNAVGSQQRLMQNSLI